jgi:alkylation response protein AidB-like acyl-CoA dehydrogenase
MDFRLTDEQRLSRRTIRDLVDRELTGVTIPVEYGGAGQSRLEGVFAIEEVARGSTIIRARTSRTSAGTSPTWRPGSRRFDCSCTAIGDELLERGAPSWI